MKYRQETVGFGTYGGRRIYPPLAAERTARPVHRIRHYGFPRQPPPCRQARADSCLLLQAPHRPVTTKASSRNARPTSVRAAAIYGADWPGPPIVAARAEQHCQDRGADEEHRDLQRPAEARDMTVDTPPR